MLTIKYENSILVHSVLLNSKDLSEIIRCEIIVKKCLPILTW